MKRIFVLFTLALPLAASAQEWAWEAGQQSHNGAIAVQSASGGTTHTLPQNPLAAVARTDQSAVTQPPTIIVQATAADGYGEVVPLIATGNVVPMCPTGYSSRWQKVGTGCPANTIYNVDGTRFSLGSMSDGSGWSSVQFFVDNFPANGVPPQRQYCFLSSGNQAWAANICGK